MEVNFKKNVNENLNQYFSLEGKILILYKHKNEKPILKGKSTLGFLPPSFILLNIIFL